ncbi:MAG: amidohydrolase [Armatimonadetes bacterium]|nr:amidohydrolase [Armatimonadota bacterium]
MKVITLEEHYTTPMYLEATKNLGPEGQAGGEEVARKQADLGDERLADMDAAGIDMQVLSLSGILLDALDPATATAVARDANDRAAQAVQDHPDRFAAFAALGVQEPETAADELRRCVRELGFRGAIVNGTAGGLFLDHPRFLPVFQAAQDLGVPVYLHPAPPPPPVRDAYYGGLPDGYGAVLSIAGWGWHVETGLHALRLIVSGLFDRLPGLQIIIGHMGENLPFSLARAESVLSRAPKPLARPLSDYFHANFHVTTSGYFTLPPFLCALEVVGADRLLFSVDYPFSTNPQGRTFLDSLPVAPADKEKIAHGNAERLLGLTP